MRLLLTLAIASVLAWGVIQALLTGRVRDGVLRTKNPAMYWTSVLVGAGITIALIASSVFWKG
jgi:hypothetical protein